MAFQFQRNIADAFSFKSIGNPSTANGKIVCLFDSELNEKEEELLQNFLKLSGEIYLFTPLGTFSEEKVADALPEIVSRSGEQYSLIVYGNLAPFIIEKYNIFRKVLKVIFINPTFRRSIATKMSSFESPSLVITATPGNLDHDPDAVKYHDLISGSSIQYIRGISGNPLFNRFTQSFNSIQRFLSDE